MKRPFSESRHIVPGLCKSLKTAAIYKNWILEEIKAQLGNNPFRLDRVHSMNHGDHSDAAAGTGEKDGEYLPMQSRGQQDGSSQPQ